MYHNKYLTSKNDLKRGEKNFMMYIFFNIITVILLWVWYQQNDIRLLICSALFAIAASIGSVAFNIFRASKQTKTNLNISASDNIDTLINAIKKTNK